MIALIDYGAGNLTSVRKALATVGATHFTPRHADELAAVDGVIVPGVGHFATTHAIDDDWRDAIRGVLARGAALFGICLGMQWLFEGSDEAPDVRGLGVFRERCVHLTAAAPSAPDAPGAPGAPVGAPSRRNSSRPSGPRRYDSVQRVLNSTGPGS